MKGFINKKVIALIITLSLLLTQLSAFTAFAEGSAGGSSSMGISTTGSGLSEVQTKALLTTQILTSSYYKIGVSNTSGEDVGYYNTWADAVTALNNTDGGTITLLDNITLSDTDVFPSKPCTIDGGENKYALTFTKDYNFLNADTTLNNLTLKTTVPTNQLVTQLFANDLSSTMNYYNITINGDVIATDICFSQWIPKKTITVNGTLTCYAISGINVVINENAVVKNCRYVQYLGNVTINGSLELGEWMYIYSGQLNGTGSITIKSVTSVNRIYLLNGSSISENADITIKYDYFVGPYVGDVFVYSDSTAPVTNIENIKFGSGYSGFALKGDVNGSNYQYTLQKAVSQVKGFNYASWADAIDAVNNDKGSTITMLDNITLSDTDVFPSKPCTIDGNDSKYSITFTKDTNMLKANTTLNNIALKTTIVEPNWTKLYTASYCTLTINGNVVGANSILFDSANMSNLIVNGNLNCKCAAYFKNMIVNENAQVKAGSLTWINNITINGNVFIDAGLSIMYGAIDGTGTIELSNWQSEIVFGDNSLISDTADLSIKPVDGYTSFNKQRVFLNYVDNTPIKNIENLKLTGAFGNYVLNGFGNETGTGYYYLLNEAVNSVSLTLSESTINYENDITASAVLRDINNNNIINSGTVDFYLDDAFTPFAQVAELTDEKYCAVLTKPAAGSHTITAKYIGSSNYVPVQTVTSEPIGFTVNKIDGLALSTEVSTPVIFNIPANLSTNTDYKINLPDALPLNKAQDVTGEIVYSSVLSSDANSLIGGSLSTNGDILTVPLKANSGTNGTATIAVTITTKNYKDITFTITLNAQTTTPYVKIQQLSMNSIYISYGDPLFMAKLEGDFQRFDNATAVSGTLCWDNPNEILPAGENKIGHFTFFPDNKEYIPLSGTAFVNVSKRPITLTLEKSQYGKTYCEADPQFNYTITTGTLVGNDVLTAPFKHDGTDAGTYSIFIDNNKNSNYTIALSNGYDAMVINKRPLTIKSVSIADREYDGTTDAGTSDDGTITVQFDNVPGDDLIYYSAQGAYADANANNNKQANVTVTLSEYSDKNYSLAVNTKAATGNILKATTTANSVDPIKVRANVEREYGFYYSPSFLSVISLSDITSDVTGKKTTGNYNSFKIYSYTSSSFFAVNPHYAENISKINFTVLGTLQPNTKGSITIEYGCQNYNTILVEVPITVLDKSEIDISRIYIYNKAYSGTAATQYLQHILFLDKDTNNYVNIDNVNYNYIGKSSTNYKSTTPPVNAGDYALVASIPDSNVDYYGSTEVPFTISKAQLTVAAKDHTITVGGAMPDYGLTYSGFISGEDENTTGMFVTAPIAGCAGNSDTAATYDITFNNPVSPNYTITTVNGKLKVNPKIADVCNFEVNSDPNTDGWFNKDIQIAANDVDGFDKIRIGDTGSFAGIAVISTEAANGTVQLYFAKNNAVTTPIYFSYQLDKTSPVLSNIVYDTGSNSIVSKIINYFTGRVSISVDCSDSLSGIKKVEYTLSGSAEKSGTASIISGKVCVSVDKGFKGTIKFTAYDNADNKTDLSSDFVTEDTAPAIGFSSAQPNGEGWYNKNVTVDITVKDDKDNAIASGIKSIDYTLNGGDVKSVDNINDANEKTFTVIISSEGLNTLTVIATDNSGTTSTQSYNVKLDKTAPNISKVNALPIDLGHHYKGYVLAISAADTGTSGIAGYSIDGGKTWQAGSTYQFLKTGYADIMVKDNADNVSAYSGNTVDIVVPKISTLVTLTADKLAASYGDIITLSAQITGEEGATEPLDGDMAFYFGTNEKGEKIAENVNFVSGKASIDLTKYIYKSIGGKNIFAVYSGNEYYAQSNSALSCNILPLELIVKSKDIVCYSGNTLPKPVVEYTGFADGEDETNTLTQNTLKAVHTASNTDTVGSYEIILNGSANATQNYYITKQNGTLTVKAASSNAIQVAPTDTHEANKPGIIIPSESVPANIGLSSLRLIINEPTQEEKAVMNEAAKKQMKNVPKNQLLQYDISLIDISNGNAIVQPNDYITIVLPYPEGTDKSYTFNIVHLVGGITPEIIPCTNTNIGMEFSVKSFSPFLIGYTTNTDNSSDNTTAQDIWQIVENEITKSKTGDVINADVAPFIETIPVEVIEAIKGKDTVLTIEWQGETIIINGKDVKDIESNRVFYTLKTLVALYKNTKADNAGTPKPAPINPKTGKCFDLENPTVIVNSIRDIKNIPSVVTNNAVNANITPDGLDISKQANNTNTLIIVSIAFMAIAIIGSVIAIKRKKAKQK